MQRQRTQEFFEAEHTPYLRKANFMSYGLYGKNYHDLEDFYKTLIVKNWDNPLVLNIIFDKVKNPMADKNVERLMKGEKIVLA